MNIKNIALVRATNTIPFDGVVHPLSSVPYLEKESGTQFVYSMIDLLKKEGIMGEMDWSKPEKIKDFAKKTGKILKEYLPYSSNYNSMVLWSLNGLVPDDQNNCFSEKTCAIIEMLEEQMETSEIVSLLPTDTAIKGSSKLSKQASILIKKTRYESLSGEEKDKLEELKYSINVRIFEGELKEAVNEQLSKSQIIPEELTLRREDKGYVPSDTSNEVIETIDNISQEHNIPQVLFWGVVTENNDDLDRLKSVNGELEKYVTVVSFYKKKFFKYLFSKMDISERVKGKVTCMNESKLLMTELCDEIQKIGIDKYKEVLDIYNNSLEKLRSLKILPTPDEIVDASKENRNIDLIALIENLEIEPKINVEEINVLSSAIDATTASTTIGDIKNKKIL